MGNSTRLKLHRWSTLVFALLSCSECALGTTISVVVIPQAVVVAADGKTTQYVNNERVPLVGQVSKKLRIMHNGIVVGSYSVAKLGDDPHPAYYLGSFFDSLEKEIGVRTTVSEAATIVADRATTAMSGFNELMSSGAITRETFIKETGNENPLAGFVVAGYESGHPVVFKIEVEIDWFINRLRGPVITPLYPSNTTMFSSDADKVGPRLPAWLKCRVPETVRSPILQTEVTARAIVDLGIEMRGNDVGLPITLVTILSNGRHRIKRYNSRMPDLCISHSAKTN